MDKTASNNGEPKHQQFHSNHFVGKEAGKGDDPVYIKAIIKNKQGEIFTVETNNGCKIVVPRGIIEQAKYTYATNFLLVQFYQKIKPYANENHAIVEIQTDNVLLVQKLSNEGHKVNYLPYVEGEAVEA